MSEYSMQSAHIRRYTLILACIWTLTVAGLLSWALYSHYQSTIDAAFIEARATHNKDLLYRRWAAMHGGVYVPVTEDTPPNPYLDVPRREVTTTDGEQLTLVNPAYMTRQVHELGRADYGIQGHITSLNPIRPGNAPDAWERDALLAFEQGETEFSSVEMVDGQPTMRYMQAMVTEESCLACHESQGYELGDVRGGISVNVPMQMYWENQRPVQWGITIGHGVLWILGIGGIGVFRQSLLASAQREEAATRLLRENEERFRAFVTQSNYGVVLIDQDARVVEWNPAQEAITGIKREEALNQPILTVQSWSRYGAAPSHAELEGLERSIRQALGGENPAWLGQTIETPIQHQDQTERIIQSAIFPIQANGTRMLASMVRDYTEQRQTENALQESEERYRSVIHAMAEGVVFQVRDGTIQTCNPAAERILGLTADQMMGRTSIDPRWYAIHEDGSPFPGETHPAMVTLQTGKPQAGVIMGVQKPDEERTWISVNSQPIFYNPKNPLPDAVVTTFVDITERKQAQKREFELALEKERRHLLTTFIETTAHEFRTPLATINSSAYLISRLGDSEKRHAKIGQIQTEVSRITKLVDTLLLMVKLEDNETLVCGPVSVDSIFELACAEMGTCHQRHKLACDIPDDLPIIEGDADYLVDAFKQLLDNACRFTPEGGTISVRAATIDEYVRLEICDTGPGIPHEAQKHIFETFWREDKAHTSFGFGLGLPIAQKIIEAHGGHIRVESAAGQGAAFIVDLPRRGKTLTDEHPPMLNFKIDKIHQHREAGW